MHSTGQGHRGESPHQASRFRTLVDSLPCGILVVDARGRITLVNREAEHLFGYSEGELLGQPVEILIPHRFHGPHRGFRKTYTAAATGRPMGSGRNLFGRRKDGREIPIEVGLSPLDTGAGPVVLATIVDISERVQGEEGRRVLVRQLVELQERERRELARELHDEIGQLLTSLTFMLEELEPSPRAEELRLLTRETLARVRDVSTSLRPPMLDELGLLPTVQWHCRRYSRNTGIEVRLSHETMTRRFGADFEIAAFRIVQEALTNVARHAGVKNAELDIRIDGDVLQIRVTDRGAGFEPRSVDPASGGIRNMGERARLLGGELRVETHPGIGVTVIARLPIDRPQRRSRS